MENINLTDTSDRAAFFRRGVLTNLEYWQNWVKTQINDIAALDQERNVIVRAISFGLDLGQSAWSSVYDLIRNLSPFMERGGHWSEWYQILSQAVNVTQHLRDSSGEVNLSALLARLSFQQSRFEESIRLYRRVIRLARQSGDYYNEARACTNLGYHYIECGQWWRAEVLCKHALKIFDHINNNHGRAHTENHLGFLYTHQRCWDQARQHLERACTIWQAMGDEHGLMYGFINLGGLYIKMEQPDPALNYLEKAVYQARLIGEEVAIGRIYMNMGLAYMVAGDLDQAEMYTYRAETIFQRYSNSLELARVWGHLGTICFRQGKWQETTAHIKKSLEMWRNLGNRIGEVNTLMDLIEYDLARKRRQQALVHLKEAEALLAQGQKDGRYNYLRSRLTKYWAELENS